MDPAPVPPPGRQLILALDGMPFDVFAELQQRGHFADFRPARRMVSTFPSLSDVAFSTMAGTGPTPGYQAMHFDRRRNRVTGNTLRSLGGKAHRHLPADTPPRSSVHRMRAYLFSYNTARRELRHLRRDLLTSAKPRYVAYVEATDAVLHVHGRDRAERFLLELETFLADLGDEVQAATGQPLAIDIVSDHGSTLQRGKPIRLERELKRCGFRRARRLRDAGDVAFTQAGIIASVALSADPSRAEALAACAAELPGVALAARVQDGWVHVRSDVGEAALQSLEGEVERYAYRLVRGVDPLDLVPDLQPGDNRVLEQEALFRETLDGPNPDPLRRLWHAFHTVVSQPPEVLLSLADGYESGNRWVRYLAALRGRQGTHGSLSARASLGLLVSNWRDLPDADAWTAHDLLFGAHGETDCVVAGEPAGP